MFSKSLYPPKLIFIERILKIEHSKNVLCDNQHWLCSILKSLEKLIFNRKS